MSRVVTEQQKSITNGASVKFVNGAHHVNESKPAKKTAKPAVKSVSIANEGLSMNESRKRLIMRGAGVVENGY